MSEKPRRQSSAEKRIETMRRLLEEHKKAFQKTPQYKETIITNSLARQNSYEKKLKPFLEIWQNKDAEKLRNKASEERKKLSEERRQVSEERKKLSAERKSAERKESERQRKLDNGELVEGTAIYEQEVVPGVISLNRSEASMENMRASNRARYNETKKANPGLFSSTRYASGKRHNKKTNKSHKKRKTHKKKSSAHKKSRKH
jgi:hypothetical protein